MSAPITSALLNALNPFRKSESENEFECGIAVITFQRGRALVEPLAARTDKLTILGKGGVDFDTENIDFNWTLKSRQGIGLPSVGSVVNPYVSLGGTLSSPQIQVKALDAAEATATLGLAIVFKGLYDRITAENNVCINSLVKVTPPDEAKLEHSGAERP